MAFRDDFAALEKDLTDAQVPVAALLEEARINRTTWMRWRESAFKPRIQTWENVQDAAKRLIAQREQAA